MRSRGEKVLLVIIFSPAILATFYYAMGLGIQLYSTLNPLSGSSRRFIGYLSNPMRIDPVNPTEVLSMGNTPTITIHEEREIFYRERVNWYSYLGNDDVFFTYNRMYKRNYSSYFYDFEDGGNTTLPRFWTKLKMYLNLTEEELQHEMGRTKKIFAAGEFNDKKPDWSLILKDLGEPISVDNSQVGYEKAYYENNTRSTLNTYCLVVETETEDSSILIQLFIDSDSDIQLKIECSDELDDPKALFIELLEHVRLPTSLLYFIELKENWLYMT
jgi:hypothetical protein